MADYYLQFSETVSGLSEPEAAWLADQLRCVAVVEGVAQPSDQIHESTVAEVAWLGPRFLLGVEGYEDSPEEPAFCFELGVDDDDADCGRYLWLYSQDHADLDQVALLVQKFLRAFRSAEIWTMTYATCSKPRCGAFGGGASIVTADTIVWHDAELIADEARQQIARQQAASQPSPTG